MKCSRTDCYWPKCVGPAGCQATPIVETQITPKRKVWKEKVVKEIKPKTSKRTHSSVSVSKVTYEKFKEVVEASGKRMGPTLDAEIRTFLSKTKDEQMAWNRRAPFDTDGNLMHHPKSYVQKVGEMREDIPFRATMTYTGFERGHSAAYTMWKDQDGKTYPMFLAELHVILPLLNQGSLTTMWQVTKRGQNFGIKLAKDL